MRIVFCERGGSVQSLYLLAAALSSSHSVSVAHFGTALYANAFHAAGISTFPIFERAYTVPKRVYKHPQARRVPGGRVLLTLTRLVIDTLPSALKFASMLRRRQTDLVHANNAPTINRAELLGARFAGIPSVCHIRCLPPVNPASLLDRLTSNTVRHFIGVSRAVSESAPHTRTMAPLTTVYDPTPVPAPLSVKQRQDGRREAGLDELACWAVIASRLIPNKGVSEALRATHALRKQGSDLRLLILGEGIEDYRLRQEAVTLGLGSSVRFVGWRPDPQRWIALADFLVQPTQLREGLPRSIIEAMACGVPVIGTDVGGTPEAFTDGVSGLLAQGQGPQPLIEPLRILAGDPERRCRMGEAARQEAERRFGIANHVAQIEAIYRQVMEPERDGAVSSIS